MRVLIVDDHPIIVSGCKAMLAGELGVEVFDAGDADAGFQLYQEKRPDIAVIDIGLPGASGFELTQRILRQDSGARIVVFSMNDDPIFARRALEAGARGYVTKSDDPYLLLQALRAVMAGGIFLLPKIAGCLPIANIAGAPRQVAELSPRETKILQMLGRGLTVTEIARDAQVSYKTIANACTIIKRKLGARTTMDLLRIALEQQS